GRSLARVPPDQRRLRAPADRQGLGRVAEGPRRVGGRAARARRERPAPARGSRHQSLVGAGGDRALRVRARSAPAEV
ncbi:MAG: hypothetical protein AVDCRST_MAG45-2441, partial [uncultured Solirubrobacterales bacterium]